MIRQAIGISIAVWATLAGAQPAPRAVTWLPAPAVYPPRLAVQFGHDSPVDAAIWRYGDLLVTADAADMTAIVWNTMTGEVIDRIPMPLLGRDGLVNGVSVRDMAFDPDTQAIAITVLAYGLPDRAGRVRGERYRLTFDLGKRQFAPVSPPTIVPVAEVDRVARNDMPVPLPTTTDHDGRLMRLSRDGNAVVVERIDQGAPAATSIVRLEGVPKGYFTDAEMSPDGFRLARITSDGRTGGETTVWDSRSSYTVPGFPTDITYDKVGWIGRDRFYAANAAGTTTAIVADAASGRILGTVPPRCLMTPVGDDGLFVAVGPGSCGAAPSAADGLWFFDRDDPAGTGFTLARRWQQRALPAAAAREIVTAITIGPSEAKIPGQWEIYAATRPRVPVGGVYSVSWLHVGSDPAQPAEFLSFFKAEDQKGLTQEQMIARRLGVSRSGDIGLWAFSGDVRLIREGAPVTGIALGTMIDRTSLLDSDDATVAVGSVADQALQRFDAKTGKRLPSLPVSGVLTGGYLSPLPLLWAASNDGALRFWDTRPPGARTGMPAAWQQGETAPLLQVFSFPGNRFFAALPDGRYDTNLGADTDAVRWIMPHRPDRPLPAQTFMRSRYEPDLMRRLLACIAANGCTAAFPVLADVRALNRAVPETRITGVTPVPGQHAVTVTAEIKEGVEAVDGKIGSLAFHTSGAHDLRMFVDGRLVQQSPDVLMTPALAADDQAWRAATAIPKGAGDSDDWDAPRTARFTVPIPSDGGPITLSAYAFNVDRIKGPTARHRYQPPPSDVPPRPRRTVLVAIGVDATANPDWRLRYAANDAERMVRALAGLPEPVVPVLLVSDDRNAHATKADIAAVLRRLNGFDTPDDAARLRALGHDSLEKLTPDDMVILTFSGHGVTIEKEFYMVPSDAVPGTDGEPLPATLMSSTELTQWARRADAARMTMIIDACYSAASVGIDGFKPGPMGDPGLGQLAFDKGIRIIAATQADNVALEDGALSHGLLTYALVANGLDKGLADSDNDGRVTMNEWLRYGAAAVPSLAAAVARGGGLALATGDRGITAGAAPPPPPRAVQKPALFDFGGDADPIVIRVLRAAQ